MDYLDSISPLGWGKLLTTFIPTNLAIFIADVIAYVLIPLAVLILLISIFKKHCSNSNIGTWRKCGKTWLKIGLYFLIFNILLYFLYNSILTTSISGIRSFQTQYREEVLGAKKGKIATENISDIASNLRNNKRKSSARFKTSQSVVVDKEPATDGKELLNELATDMEKKHKLSETEANALISDTPSSEPSIQKVSIKSNEYKVVKFFYNGYPWLHHLLYAVIWLFVLAGIFWPGFKMQKQKTIIKH